MMKIKEVNSQDRSLVQDNPRKRQRNGVNAKYSETIIAIEKQKAKFWKKPLKTASLKMKIWCFFAAFCADNRPPTYDPNLRASGGEIDGDSQNRSRNLNLPSLYAYPKVIEARKPPHHDEVRHSGASFRTRRNSREKTKWRNCLNLERAAASLCIEILYLAA